MDKYTTNELITAQSTLPEKEQTEKTKTILSNDAYALREILEELKKVMLRA
jgi:hypothetical protein